MDTSQLEVLMGGYYHEDFEGIWESLDLYIGHSSPQERGLLLGEIAGLLTRVASNVDLDAYLENLGSNVYLGEDPAAYRTWLEEIVRRVTAA